MIRFHDLFKVVLGIYLVENLLYRAIGADHKPVSYTHLSLGHNILGKKGSLMKFTRDDLLRFIGRTYNTDQMVFSMIGNISEKRFTELCNRYLGETASHPRTFERDRTDRYVPMTRTLHRSSHQAHCIIGNQAYSLREEKRIPLSLLTNQMCIRDSGRALQHSCSTGSPRWRASNWKQTINKTT